MAPGKVTVIGGFRVSIHTTGMSRYPPATARNAQPVPPRQGSESVAF